MSLNSRLFLLIGTNQQQLDYINKIIVVSSAVAEIINSLSFNLASLIGVETRRGFEPGRIRIYAKKILKYMHMPLCVMQVSLLCFVELDGQDQFGTVKIRQRELPHGDKCPWLICSRWNTE